MKRKRLTLALIFTAVVLLVATVVYAQEILVLTRWTVDSGGALSQGGNFVLHGTIGQPDAAQSLGGDFTLSGGFWAGGVAAEPELYRILMPITVKN